MSSSRWCSWIAKKLRPCSTPDTVENAQRMALSTSYMDQTLAFIVKYYRREDFNSRKKLKSLQKLKLGIPDVPYYIAKIRDYLPQAEVVILNSPREFFTRKEIG